VYDRSPAKAATAKSAPPRPRMRTTGHLLPLDSAKRTAAVQRVRSVGLLPRTHGIGHIPVIAERRPDDVNAWYEVNCGRTRRRPASSEGRMSAAHPSELTRP
jgi:hypothetical protein